MGTGVAVNEPDGVALSDADYQAHANFRYAIRRFERFSEQQARSLKVMPQQHLLLLIVRGHPSYPMVSITEIAERLQVRHHSASLLVHRSVEKGYLTREKDARDRRRVMVSLTPEGERLLARITLANRQELLSLDDALFQIRHSLRRTLEHTAASEADGSPKAMARSGRKR